MGKKKHKVKITKPKAGPRLVEINKLKKEAAGIRTKLDQHARTLQQEHQRRDSILKIEASYKRDRVTHLLGLNSEYVELKKIERAASNGTFNREVAALKSKLSACSEQIRKLEAEKEKGEQKEKGRNGGSKSEINQAPNDKQKPVGKSKHVTKSKIKPGLREKSKPTGQKKYFSPNYYPSGSTSEVVFEADWDLVTFKDGCITIKHEGHWLRKDIGRSKEYLNNIKHYYKFHHVPRLIVVLAGLSIKQIKNEEVLFYHIDFFTIAAAGFGIIRLDPFKLKNWRKYTKQHYKTNLSFAFQTETLKLLCEYSDINLPIIPVGEAVINSAGIKIIHNSFLFPLKSVLGYYLVWESIQEAKASYVFSLSVYDDRNVQIIFDYIAGSTANKRSTLMHSRDLQDRLKMKGRVVHSDLNSWDLELKSFVRMV